MDRRPLPRPARAVLHLVAVTALATGGIVLTGTAGHAQDPARPDSFGGIATASALHFVADRNPQPTPVSDAFHAEVPYSTTSFDSSGNASARAASIYPGAGFLGVPGLLCQFNAQACQVISAVPPYPFIAQAQYPDKPDDAATVNSGAVEQAPLQVTPVGTTAHATPDGVEAKNSASSAGVQGLVSVGNTVTHSKQVFEGSTLVVTAESAVTDVDLAGALHIDGIRSTAVAKVDGAKITSAVAKTTISGASINGVPVVIDSTGVHVAGEGDNGALNAAANTVLATFKATGIEVRLLDPLKKVKGGGAAASTGGLLISFENTVNLPDPPPPPDPRIPTVPRQNGDYTGSVTLAGAGVAAHAAPGLDFSFPAPEVPLAPPPALQGSVQQPTASGPLTPAGPAVAPAAPAPAAPQTAAAPKTHPAAVLGVDLSSKRLKTLALILLGYPLLVLLTGPLRAPARLPRVS
jgi:hypothetical protein